MADVNRSILVTGATGFLGGAVVRRLLALGVPVLAVGRNRAKLADLAALGCDEMAHDIAQPFKTTRPLDAVIHCAALSSPFGPKRDFKRVNVDGTRHVLDFAVRANAQRFIHISTPSVYFSYEDQLDVREDVALPPPVNAYANTKRIAEGLVQASPIPSITLRPRGIYGPGDTTLLPRLLRAARSRPLPLLRGGRAAIDLTYIEDVVTAIMIALKAPDDAVGEVYNVSGGECLPVCQIVEMVCQKAGFAPRWRRVPLSLAMMVARMMEAGALALPNRPEPAVTPYSVALFAYRQSLDLTKARDQLGWSPTVAFKQGLARTFEAAT